MTDRKRTKRTLYICWNLFVSLLWFFVLFLFLELGAVLFQLSMERTNPLISAYRSGQPLPDTSSITAIKNAACYFPEDVGGLHFKWQYSDFDVPIRRVLKWGPRHGSLSADERRARHLAFGSLNETAREAYALLHRELIFALDKHYRVREVYGKDRYLFTGFQGFLIHLITRGTGVRAQIYQTIHEANLSGSPKELRVAFPHERLTLLYLSFICLPARSDDSGRTRSFVFWDTHPEVIIASLTKGTGQLSRWDVPYFRFKANYNEGADEAFRTNSMGFRSPEVVIPKPKHTFRIICIGGSTTEEGATNETTYPALLETRLRQALPGTSIEVVNAGTPGLSTDGHLLRLYEYLRLEPDLVIAHLGVNDVIGRYERLDVNLLPRVSRFFRYVLPSLCTPSPDVFAADHRQTAGVCMELMTVLLQQHGVTVAFASMAFPDSHWISWEARQYYNYQALSRWKLPAFSLGRYNMYMNENNRMLDELSRKYHAFYIPVAERIRGGTDIFDDFCHMLQSGIVMKADVMFDCVIEILDRHFGLQ